MPAGHDADDETRERNETKLQIFDCMMVLRGGVMFIYKQFVSNYLMLLEACHAGFQACAECNPYTAVVFSHRK